jgi:hypothetical protein
MILFANSKLTYSKINTNTYIDSNTYTNIDINSNTDTYIDSNTYSNIDTDSNTIQIRIQILNSLGDYGHIIFVTRPKNHT